MFVCAECGASQPVAGRCGADGTELAPIGDDLLIGTTIGAYRVARLLGVGGMGRVYKGVHPQIGSRVAIKVLSRECSDRRDLVDRFFAEAKAVNLIRHESIVNVLDLSTLPDGRPYIVMEYLDGSPLAGIVEHAQRTGVPLPIGGVVRLVAEVLDALGAAHAKGIIHRDLKPDNIFVTPAGRAKVLDFGIAKLQPELGGSATHTGSLLGTPHYMSPEQASGRPVDQRADIYAIGVILFECTTLQKPFVAESLFDLLRKHIEAPPPSPRALRRDLPEPMEHIIYTALAKVPEQRFASAQAMSMALQHATQQLPSEQWAPITPASSRAGGWQPTPPASWASKQPTPPASWAPNVATGQQPNIATGQPNVATGGQPNIATGVTPTSGQVATTSPGGSSKALWLGLSALLVVGGGIAGAVIAGGGDDNDDEVAAAGSATGSATGSDSVGSATAAGSDTWAAAGSADVAAPAGSAAAPPSDDEPDDDEADDDELDANTTAMMDDAVGQMFDSLDPSARALLPPELGRALKKYGAWSKIPKAERMKLLATLQGARAGLTAKAFQDANAALAGIPSVPPSQRPPPAKTTPPSQQIASTASSARTARNVPGLDAEGWVVSRRFKPPGAYNVKKLSIEKYLPFALAEAKKLVPDAVLFRIDAEGVYPDGHADITLADNGSLDFRFISPSRSKGDPKLPVGAKQEYKCMFRIMLDEEGAWSAPLSGWECKEPLLGPPKCTSVQVWKKALAKGAPANAIAELGYRGWAKKARWYFSIEGTKISEVFDDDCR